MLREPKAWAVSRRHERMGLFLVAVLTTLLMLLFHEAFSIVRDMW